MAHVPHYFYFGNNPSFVSFASNAILIFSHFYSRHCQLKLDIRRFAIRTLVSHWAIYGLFIINVLLAFSKFASTTV